MAGRDEAKDQAKRTGASEPSESPQAEPQGAEPEEPTFPVERLVSESEAFFGHPSHVAAGAFWTLRKKNLTREEGKAAIEKFVKQPDSTERATETPSAA